MLTSPDPRVVVSRRPPQLAAGERAAGPVERQVVEPDLAQVVEPVLDLVENPRAATGSPRAGPSSSHELDQGLADRQGRQLGDVDAADLDRQRLGAKPGPVAVGTGLVAPPAAQEDRGPCIL